MLRRLAISFTILLLATTGMVAQQSTDKPSVRADTATAKFTGVWEGTYTTDHTPPGGMRVEITRDTAWTVSTNIVADHAIQSSGTGVRIDGNVIKWTQDVMGMTCETSSTVGGTG